MTCGFLCDAIFPTPSRSRRPVSVPAILGHGRSNVSLGRPRPNHVGVVTGRSLSSNVTFDFELP